MVLLQFVISSLYVHEWLPLHHSLHLYLAQVVAVICQITRLQCFILTEAPEPLSGGGLTLHDAFPLTNCLCNNMPDFQVCLQQNDSTVVLDTVPYAAGGAWAVNLWMKPGSIYGDDFQYLFSHAEDKFYATGYESNQAGLLIAAVLGSHCMAVHQSSVCLGQSLVFLPKCAWAL